MAEREENEIHSFIREIDKGESGFSRRISSNTLLIQFCEFRLLIRFFFNIRFLDSLHSLYLNQPTLLTVLFLFSFISSVTVVLHISLFHRIFKKTDFEGKTVQVYNEIVRSYLLKHFAICILLITP